MVHIWFIWNPSLIKSGCKSSSFIRADNKHHVGKSSKVPSFFDVTIEAPFLYEIHMEHKTLWLIDKEIPEDFKKAYKEAVRDKSTAYAVLRVIAALHQLIEESGFHEELQNAVLDSTANGTSILEHLNEREINILAQIEVVQAEKRVYEKLCLTRKSEVQPILNECMRESSRLSDEMKALQARINGFAASRAATQKKYEAAGLSEADIDAIGGIKPTSDDLASWKSQLAEMTVREMRINDFFRSAPDYDTSLLDIKAKNSGDLSMN
jgi:hypothetical protein